jgi:flagellar biosynthesis component FlhA
LELITLISGSSNPEEEIIVNEEVLSFISKRYSRHIIKKNAVEEKLSVFLLGSETEDLFYDSKLIGANNEFTANPDILRKIEAKFSSINLLNSGFAISSLVILCRSELKSRVESFLKLKSYFFETISYEDLNRDINLFCIDQL